MDRKLVARDRDFIRSKLLEGWTYKQIGEHLDVNPNILGAIIKEFGLNNTKDGDILDKMRKTMEAREIFGKLCEETEKNIVTLLRKGVTPEIVGDFMGLRCEAASLEFFGRRTITFQSKCKQARAESAIRLILAAHMNPKPNDALRLLSQSDVTRGMYKVPKEQKEAIKIEFPDFIRDTDKEET